jgi:hypothetical protein
MEIQRWFLCEFENYLMLMFHLNFWICVDALLEKFTWLVTEKARDGKYSHCAGKFTDTMHVKDQIEKLIFEF